MREFSLIAAIRRMLPPPSGALLVGPGDDAAVLRTHGRPFVVSTDTQIEGVHFRSEWSPPGAQGARAVETALSDLAAMGARPEAVLLSLQLPSRMAAARVLSFVRGAAAQARSRACTLAGGNVAVCDGPFSATLTVLGEMPPKRAPCLRSAARAGHVILATGMPGLARLGLETLSRGVPPAGFLRRAVRRFLRPRACFEEVEFMLAHARLGAVIDLSDGLAGDLARVAEESGLGAVIDAPLDALFMSACHRLGLDPEECFLGPSDDYELLITCAPAHATLLKTRFAERFGRPLAALGCMTPGPGIARHAPGGRPRRMQACSYEHGKAPDARPVAEPMDRITPGR